MECNICGSTEFLPGFNGRIANGLPPMCRGCRSVERHRIVRRIYLPLRPLLDEWRALQFAPDRSVDRFWFKEYLGSSYGGENTIDMIDTGLPDGRFDIVISNHVLEHVRDDKLAMAEMLRVVGAAGVVHLTVPTPTYRWETIDWGFPDPKVNEHYRDFGADFAQNMVRHFPGLACAAVVSFDPVTGAGDLVYFFSMSQDTLGRMGERWNRHAVPLTRVF
ncbi:class I SAM-dependent methyltransferase [Phreatobacter sp.]|uniref:class I SAM-dependent methyltransferase n=1 Tax=Phreatobacter sp. TaxID=1966341 RepID=UPI003F704C45